MERNTQDAWKTSGVPDSSLTIKKNHHCDAIDRECEYISAYMCVLIHLFSYIF